MQQQTDNDEEQKNLLEMEDQTNSQIQNETMKHVTPPQIVNSDLTYPST